MSDADTLLLEVAEVLDKLKVPYYVTGGVAVLAWGRPRFTVDIDVVVALGEEKVDALARALRALDRAGYVEETTARTAVRRRGEFNFISPGSGTKVDFWIMKEGAGEDRVFARRVARKLQGQRIFFISPEDLILQKIMWYKKSGSSRHLEDAESVIAIQREKLDYRYLRRIAKAQSIRTLLEKVLKQRR